MHYITSISRSADKSTPAPSPWISCRSTCESPLANKTLIYRHRRMFSNPELFYCNHIIIETSAVIANAVVEWPDTMLDAPFDNAAVVKTSSKPMSELL